METILLYLILSILLFQLFIFAVLTFKPTNSCCKEDCCCEKEKSCSCDEEKSCDCGKPFIIEGYNDKEKSCECGEDSHWSWCEEYNNEEKSCSCKGDNNLVCKCGQPKINDFSGKTKVSALGTPENINKSFRGKPYKDEHTKQLTPNLYGDDDFATPTKDDKHNRDYINFLDEQERKAQKDYKLKDSEPLEENDPNINKK